MAPEDDLWRSVKFGMRMLGLVRTAFLFLMAGWQLSATGALAADGMLVRRFASAQAPSPVRSIDASEDSDTTQAIYAGDDGDIYLLDQVNGRILRFDPRGGDENTRAYELPEGLQPTDLVVTGSHIMVWDGDVHALQLPAKNEGSRGIDEISTRDVDDEFAVSMFAQMGSQKPEPRADVSGDNTRAVQTRKSAGRQQQAVATRGEGPVLIDVAASDKQPTLVDMSLRRKGEARIFAKLRVQVRDRIGAAEFLEIDRAGRMFVLVENIPPSEKKAAIFVARFSRQGRLESIYDIPLSANVALSRRFIAVSPDGDVYLLRARKGEVEVLGVGSRAVRNETVVDGPTPPSAATNNAGFPGKGFVAAVRPLTREQVVQTAYAFEGVQWKVTSTAYGRDPDTACTGFHRIRRPGYLIGKLGQQVRGVPYCWGCHGSLAQIGAKIAQGALAGNVCTRNEPRSDTVGVDCSAFVSAAWGLSQHFTTVAIPSITHRVENAWDLRPGDALNKPGSHVMLFLRFTPDRKVEVMESSPGACNGRVCRNIYPLASILARGYTPVRFRALANEPAPQLANAEAKRTVATSTKKNGRDMRSKH